MHTFAALILFLPTLVASLGAKSNHSRLHDDLLRDYDTNDRPAGPNGTNATYVVLKPRLYAILEVMGQILITRKFGGRNIIIYWQLDTHLWQTTAYKNVYPVASILWYFGGRPAQTFLYCFFITRLNFKARCTNIQKQLSETNKWHTCRKSV